MPVSLGHGIASFRSSDPRFRTFAAYESRGNFSPNQRIGRVAPARGKRHDAHEGRGRARRGETSVHRHGISRKPARRPRGLHLRRARRRRDHASRLPQRGALDRPALRRAARSGDQGRADLPDRYRLGRLHAQILSRRALARGPDRPARGDRRLGAHVLRLDGAHAGLQGVADEHARRPARVLWKVLRQCEELVPARAGTRAVHEPRDRQSAARPQQGARTGARRVHHDPEGDGWRLLRVRRQGGGDLLGDHALQLPRPERRDAGERPGSRDHVHRADERAGREAVLPHLLRDDGERDGHAVRLSALLALRRERRDLRVRQRADPLGGRAGPPRRGEDQDLLSALGLHSTASSSRAARGSP